MSQLEKHGFSKENMKKGVRKIKKRCKEETEMIEKDEAKALEPEQLDEVSGGGLPSGGSVKWVRYTCGSCSFVKDVIITGVQPETKTCPKCGGEMRVKKKINPIVN